jgi:hypothetical protein
MRTSTVGRSAAAARWSLRRALLQGGEVPQPTGHRHPLGRHRTPVLSHQERQTVFAGRVGIALAFPPPP